MKRFRDRRLILLGLGALAFLLVWSQRREPEFPPVAIPDGVRIQVTRHPGQFKHYSPDQTPLSLALSTLPPGLVKFLPQFVRRHIARPVYASEAATLAIWLMGDLTSSTAPTTPHWVMQSAVADRDSGRSNSIGPTVVRAAGQGGGGYYEGFFFAAPPVSSSPLTALVYSQFGASNRSPIKVTISQANGRIIGVEFIPNETRTNSPPSNPESRP